MESGIYWVVGAVLLAGVLWLVFRPRPGRSADLAEALRREPLILDVRTPGEFGQGHVDGARNVPVGSIGDVVDGLGDKGAPIVLYCRSGGRSAQAARILRAAGYTDVTDGGPMSAVQSARAAAEAR